MKQILLVCTLANVWRSVWRILILMLGCKGLNEIKLLFCFLLEADTYPWQACLDEATNCYYYWNMETNEVQWHPPEQFLSAAPEVQTTSDDKVHVPGHKGEKEGEQHRQDDEENSEAKGVFV